MTSLVGGGGEPRGKSVRLQADGDKEGPSLGCSQESGKSLPQEGGSVCKDLNPEVMPLQTSLLNWGGDSVSCDEWKITGTAKHENKGAGVFRISSPNPVKRGVIKNQLPFVQGDDLCTVEAVNNYKGVPSEGTEDLQD